MNILPILNTPHPVDKTYATRYSGTVEFTSMARPSTVDRVDGDIWNEVDGDGSCVIAVHEWSTSVGDWVHIKP